MKQEKLNNIPAIPTKIEELKILFPEYFDKNGKFLIEKFTQDIQNQIDISKETYSLEWLGKSYARVLATEPVRTLLKENEKWNKREENKNSENLLIKGDNLEVLKHLVHAYENEIKMIYIDPPYNTGEDKFIYQDNRKFTPEELSKLAGIDIEKAKRILSFLDSKSNSHSAWLTFMYPRLYIAKRLLKDDGVIFISIDDNEMAQLKILMDEIFGEENSKIMVWKKKGGASNTEKTLGTLTEYILCYFKSKNNKSFNFRKIDRKYKFKDEKGKYNLESLEKTNLGQYERKSMYYPVINPINKKIYYPQENNRWIVGKEQMEKLIKENKIYFDEQKNKIFRIKREEDYQQSYNVYYNLLDNHGSLKVAKDEISVYFGKEYREIFDTPKPTKLIKFLVSLATKKEDIVLDFFAGSGTTGDAVMQLNSEDNGNRKFILVQLPEEIDSKDNKTAYDFVKNKLKVENPTIYDITKERLIRSAKKIIVDKKNEIEEIKSQIIEKKSKEKQTKKDKEKLAELENLLEQKKVELENILQLDLGFKEFETIPLPEENLQNIEELTEGDLFKEINDKNALLTTWKVFDNIKLHKQLKEMDFNGYKGYFLENNLYLIDAGFTLDNLAAILKKIDTDKDFIPSKVVINGYAFDSKTQREIYESINNYNKKDLDKIELIIRY